MEETDIDLKWWLEKAMGRWKNKPRREEALKLREVTVEEIRKKIRMLKTSGTEGLDNISKTAIKDGVDILAAPLQHAVNLSIRLSTFPQDWKLARVKPIYKSKGESMDLGHYRPVSILGSLSKVLERVIFDQMFDYMITTHQLNEGHHAYRSNMSTVTGLLEFVNSCQRQMEEDNQSRALLIDMSAAFDMVDVGILVDKLARYNIDESTLRWTVISARKVVLLTLVDICQYSEAQV